MSITLRVRSLVWFATGAVLAVAATVIITTAWRADAAPGDTDTTFVPIAPCRLFDYRPGAGISTRDTPLGPGETYVQQVTGTVGACNIPTDAVGVALNVTATAPTATSNLRIFPADVAVPNASNLNWVAGQGATPNKVDVKLSATGAIGIYNDFGTVIPLGDATGYYSKASLVELQNQINILKASRSFARSVTGGDLQVDLTTPLLDTVVRSITVTAPVAGVVTVNSSVSVENTDANAGPTCSITAGTTFDGTRQQDWLSKSAGTFGQLAGTRGFAIAAGATASYSLVCHHVGPGLSRMRDPALTAIFTPDP